MELYKPTGPRIEIATTGLTNRTPRPDGGGYGIIMYIMKLITYQSLEATKFLLKNGFLICDAKYIDNLKTSFAYSWLIKKMNKQIPNNEHINYPIWCWVRCYDSISPKRRRGKPVDGFEAKITFKKDKKDVFITDYRRYSFVLNNMYIPKDVAEKERFDKMLHDNHITREELKAYARRDKFHGYRTDEKFIKICDMIEKSFDRCITEDSDVLQGCVWKISLDEVEKIEYLTDRSYTYGSLNYVRANGERFDWIDDFYKRME